jgi:hypothetical protein
VVLTVINLIYTGEELWFFYPLIFWDRLSNTLPIRCVLAGEETYREGG